jgi:hypothetical protein
MFELVDLVKVAIALAIPFIISKAFSLFRRRRAPSPNAVQPLVRSLGKSRISALVLSLYVAAKLARVLFVEEENFYSVIQARLDSPAYMIRNQYRSYLERWSSENSSVAQLIEMRDARQDLTSFEDSKLLKEFQVFEYLSEQLKIKERKEVYSKFGEYAFMNCRYCTKDYDYTIFLVPFIILEHALFLKAVGYISASTSKARWRPYAVILSLGLAALEVYAYLGRDNLLFEAYNSIFGDDQYTLKAEKIAFLRDSAFILMALLTLVFELPEDLRLETAVDAIKSSVRASALTLQSLRLQHSALFADENLSKHVMNAAHKHNLSREVTSAANNVDGDRLTSLAKAVDFDALLSGSSNS